MNYIIDPRKNQKYSIYSNYGIKLLKKYIVNYQSGGSKETTKGATEETTKGATEESTKESTAFLFGFTWALSWTVGVPSRTNRANSDWSRWPYLWQSEYR